MSTERSRASGAGLPYLPALDGLRAIAVGAVLVFHGKLGVLPGGHLGVTMFFTLSGFLITTLLLTEHARTGRIDLPRFWGRRARRLVPAMLVCLPLVALVVHASPTPVSKGVLGDAIASATWVANWRFILHHQTYADLLSLPSPFQHFWSLGVEEQFYVVFPLLLVTALASSVVRRRRLMAGLSLLIVASTLDLARLNATGRAFTRAYYGTDSRIAELLVGALLAVLLVDGAGLRSFGRRAQLALSAAGVLGAIGLAIGLSVLGTDDPRLYRGGFLAIALCTAAVITAGVQPQSLVSRALSAPPLVGLGVISYGVYLYHWPLFLVVTTDNTGQSGLGLFAVRVLLTLVIAVASYGILEQPVRSGILTRSEGLTGWALGAVAGVTAVALAAGVITVPMPHPDVTTAQAPTGLASHTPGPVPSAVAKARAHTGAAGTRVAGRAVGSASSTSPFIAAPHVAVQTKAAAARVPTEFLQTPSNSKVPPVPAVPPGALKVAVVGDSIGNNLGRGLVAWAKGRTDVVVYNLSIPACPFSRGRDRRLAPGEEFDVDPACAWWDDASTQRRQAFEQFAPDIVVTQDAINEVFERRRDEWGGWRSAGEPQFDTWLSSEYQTVFGQWSGAGATVLVTNAPCGDWTRSFQDVQSPKLRIDALNVTYSRLPGVTVADFNNRVCPGGRYSDTVEGVPNARPDGFHFTDEAAEALARNWLGPLVLQTAQRRSPLQR